ncbi:MAG: hypothetical protein WCS65_05355 [Verrucomicrobiae bacterium]
MSAHGAAPDSDPAARLCSRRLCRGLRLLGRAAACLVLWLALAACQCRPQVGPANRNDLVAAAREWRAEGGIPPARDRLSEALIRRDADGGSLEKRVLRTNADKDLRLPDSISALTRKQKARTGIFLVLGYHTKSGRSEPVIQQVEAFLKAGGWHAVLVPVPMHGTTAENSAAIQAVLARELPGVGRAIVVGFSKGALDWMHWFAGYSDELPASQRKKIRLVVSFAGALRGASVARWMAEGRDPVAAVLRMRLRMQAARALPAVRSAGQDPWGRPGSHLVLAGQVPRLQSVSFVAVPEGADGQTHVDRRFSRLGRLATAQWSWLGPVDGLVESAGQVLPVEAHVPQHIVRVFGSHALLDGRYVNGSAVSQVYQRCDASYWRGGEELLDDLLRAIPRKWVWAGE